MVRDKNQYLGSQGCIPPWGLSIRRSLQTPGHVSSAGQEIKPSPGTEQKRADVSPWCSRDWDFFTLPPCNLQILCARRLWLTVTPQPSFCPLPNPSSQPGNGNFQGWGWAQNSPQLLPNTLGRTSAVQAASTGSSANLSTNLNTFRAFEEGQTPTGHYQSQNTHTLPLPLDISKCCPRAGRHSLNHHISF